MNLLKLASLVLFSCLRSKADNSTNGYSVLEFLRDFGGTDISTNDDMYKPENCCLLDTNTENKKTMPIPYRKMNDLEFVIQYPNLQDQLVFLKGDTFKLLCAKTRFVHLNLMKLNEIEIKCVGNNTLEYNGLRYNYEEFECETMPRSEIVVTGKKCQKHNHTVVISVGFHSYDGLIVVYNVCFDLNNKNPLYSWYNARYPFYDSIQSYTEQSPSKSSELYDNINVEKLYDIDEQRKTMKEIVKSYKRAQAFIISDGLHALTDAQLSSRSEFYYIFEQYATNYYFNSAPMWQELKENQWADLEESFPFMMRDQVDNHYLIVSGTYGYSEFPDVSNNLKPVFIGPSNTIPAPKFFWKLMYNIRERDGIVYLDMNHPYLEVEYLCENICPAGYKNKALLEPIKKYSVYCCRFNSFEKSYGKLDPIVFKTKPITSQSAIPDIILREDI